jgi:hypothetical protein
MSWDSFASAKQLIHLGEQAARAALPAIQKWLASPTFVPDLETKASTLASQLGSVTAASRGVPSPTQIQS